MRATTTLISLLCLLLGWGFLGSGSLQANELKNPSQQTFADIRRDIDEGDLELAEQQLKVVYQALEQNEELNTAWLGHYYLAKAYLMFAQAPAEEKHVRNVLGLAQSELNQHSSSSAYADAWLLQLMINAKHRDYSSVMAQVNEVIQLAQHHKDTELTIDALIFAADFTSEYGNPLLAIEYLRKAKHVAAPFEDPRLEANLDLSYARFYTNVMMANSALQLLPSARQFFQQNGPLRKQIEALIVIARNSVLLKQYQKAESMFLLADKLATEAQLPALQLDTANGLAEIYLLTDQTDKAVQYIAIGKSLANSVQEHYRFAILQANYAISIGDLALAQNVIKEAEELLLRLPQSAKESISGSAIYQVRGKLAAAQSDAATTLQQMQTYNDKIIERLRYVVAGGIETLLAEMEYERVTSKNELLNNRNLEFQNQLEAAKERQRLQWTVNIMGTALLIMLLLFFKRLFTQRKRLEVLADTDALTGLLNRRAAIENAQSWLRDRRLPETSFALFDIDFFKKVNDQHGHQVGDRVLQQFAEVTRTNCRESDVLARIGGEEFLLVLPGCCLQKAEQRAEKIRQAFATHTFTKNLRVTASFGVASGYNIDFEKLYEAADRALYKAKEVRNKVYVDPDSPHINLDPLQD